MEKRLEILCYGHDRSLLDARRMLLQSSYRVETASTLPQVAHLGGAMDIALVVICHSVEETECRRVMQISSALWPNAGFMSVTDLGEHGSLRDALPSHYQTDPAP